jgi:hypothetical protein
VAVTLEFSVPPPLLSRPLHWKMGLLFEEEMTHKQKQVLGVLIWILTNLPAQQRFVSSDTEPLMLLALELTSLSEFTATFKVDICLPVW